jgi:hypothetical protein
VSDSPVKSIGGVKVMMGDEAVPIAVSKFSPA